MRQAARMAGNRHEREGGLQAPVRNPLKWKDPDFFDEKKLNDELYRVFDICHGCRRCVNLCNAFPTLFDLVDSSSTLEIDGVDQSDYYKVSAHCYLCDLCYMTKCPYVPPHEWAVDFPKLMLRAKAVAFRKNRVGRRDRLLASTDALGRFAGIPIVAPAVNAMLASRPVRKQLDKRLGIHPEADLPAYVFPARRRKIWRESAHESAPVDPIAGERTTGKVALFSTCLSNYHLPQDAADLRRVFEHNGIAVVPVPRERCCGMPKLELGDLNAVEKMKEANLGALTALIDEGCDIVAPLSSCVLMFKQELPLMFSEDAAVQRLKRHVFDPAEYLMLRHEEGLLNIDFKAGLGKVVYHASCHTRAQAIGLKTRDLLRLIPDTRVETVERCSGHDGTYAVKSEFRSAAVKIARPAARGADDGKPDYLTGDCALARRHIASLMQFDSTGIHPMSLLRVAYGI